MGSSAHEPESAASPWAASYPAGVPLHYRYPDVPLTRLLDDAARDFPDRPAIEYRGYRMTYRKLLDHTDRLATALAALDVGRGDHVRLHLPNCPQLLIGLFATWRVGATADIGSRAVDAAPPAAQRAHTTSNPPADASSAPPDGGTTSPPRVVIVHDRWRHTDPADGQSRTVTVTTSRADYLPFPRNVASSLRDRVRRDRRPAGVVELSDLIRRNHPVQRSDEAATDDLALSGPDVAATQRQLVVNCFQLRLWLPDVVAGDERIVLMLPAASSIGIIWLLTGVLSAATIILIDDSRAAMRQRNAVRAQPTVLPLDPNTTRDLVRSSWRRGTLQSVRIAVSALPLDAADVTRLEQMTDKGRIRGAWSYGGMLTHADPIYGRVRPGSVGLPLPDTTVRVTQSASHDPVSPGACGQLWLSGPQLASPGWIDTGRTATLDVDGYLHLDAAEGGGP